jgi:hypothetical protein
MQLIEVGNGRVTILDVEGLKGVAEFDASYLYLEKEAR